MIKYYTIAYRDDFDEIKRLIQMEIGIKRLQRIGEPQALMGNYRIQEFRVALNGSMVVKIEGPEFILKEFLNYLGV